MARRLFAFRGVRFRNGELAAGTTYVAYTDSAGTVLADVSDSSGGSALAGSSFTLGTLGDYDLYGPPAGTDTLYLRCSTDPTLGVQRVKSDPDERLDALEAGGGGGVSDHGALTGLADDDHPQYETSAEAAAKVIAHEVAANPHAVYATDTDLTTHVAAADPHPGYVLETLFDAKGDLIAASAADTASQLAVGANDTVLTADSTTGTGLKWAAPAAGGIPATLFDAKGDLIGASAADTAARLAVGADGTQLVADSAQPTGLRWATAGPFPSTIPSGLLTGAASIGVNNTGYYMLVTSGGIQTISSLVIYLAVSSGNISVAVYSSTGSGRTRAPSSRLATSGAIASPGTGERTISLGGSVTVVPYETWFFVSADNTTATFMRASNGLTETMKGLATTQATAHPAPASAASLTSGALATFWIVGV